jgi:branched-chain amino acid aminotransferase
MSAAFIQANTNGRLHPAAEPSISPLNRGFLYGDAIYEVWRTYHGVLFGWEEHFARLETSAQALHLTVPFTRTEMIAEIRRTVAAFRAAAQFTGEIYVRLQLSRGGGPIGLDIALADRPEFVLLVQPCPGISEQKAREGLVLSIARELRRNPIESLSPAWKTGNYLNNILGLREARARGADDVLMLNLRGEITEASTSNVGFVHGDEVITPPLPAGILAGVTRRLLLEKVAPHAGVVVRQATVRPEELAQMRECFVLGSTRDLAAVSAIDDFRFRIGSDTLTAKLKDAFLAYTREYAAAHPELKV